MEDLPIAPEGYDRQKVREAFDAFYRHAAQLDAALRTLEAVDTFQRTAADLRADLRTIRATGFTAQTWQRSYGPEPRLRRPLVPEAFPRVAAEVVFLVAVAVALGVSGWGALRVIGVMTLALVLVWAVEWLASREGALRAPAKRPAAKLASPPAEVIEEPEAPAAFGWAAFAEREEDRADAMTMVEPLPRPEPIAELEAPAAEDDAEVAAPEPEPELEPEYEREPELAVAPEPEPAAEVAAEPKTEAEEVELAVEADKPVSLAPERAPAVDEASPFELSAEEEPPEAAAQRVEEAEAPEREEAPELVSELPEAAEDQALMEAEEAEEQVASLEQTGVESIDEVSPDEFAAERPSLWERIRGRGPEDEVVVEPPASHVRLLAADDEPGSTEAEQPVAFLEAAEDQPDEPVAEHEPQEPAASVDQVEEDVTGAEGEDQDLPPPRRHFWQGRRAPEVETATESELLAEIEVDHDESGELEPEPLAAEAAVDPWEQGFELPSEPEPAFIPEDESLATAGPLEVEELEEIEGPDLFERAEDEPLVRAAADAEEYESIEPEQAAPARAFGDGLAAAEPFEQEVESRADSDEPEVAQSAEAEELPIEVLAEQAAAALERSRARRRELRRARRR